MTAEGSNESVPEQHAPGNELTGVYESCSVARLYAAAVRTAAELHFPMRRDDARTTLSFVLGGANTAWPSQQFTAVVQADGDGARIVLNARPTGYRMLMADWHQAKAVSILYMDRLSTVLAEARETDATAPPRPTMAEQLRSLADLHERGLLSDDEFTVAKERVLG